MATRIWSTQIQMGISIVTHPNDRILNWIGPDGVDYDYTGTRPDASYMNDEIETEYGRMTIREYLQTVKRKYAKDST